MSGVLRPVGSAGSATYWRRRAVLALALVTAVLLAWFVGSAAFGSDVEAQQPDGQAPPGTASLSATPDPGTSTPTPPSAPDGASAGEGPTPSQVAATGAGTAAATEVPSPAASPSGSPAPSAAATAGPASSPSPAPAAPACAPADLRISVEAANDAIEAGDPMMLVMKVTNLGAAACSRDVGTAVNELRITSGPALVWSSTFCAEKGSHKVVELPAGGSWSGRGRWPGRITVHGCPAEQPRASAGSYRAEARNGHLQSQPDRFLLK